MSFCCHPNKVFTPSPRNYGDVIAAAVLNSDMTTAWELYDELMEKGLSPHMETWDILFTGAKKTEEDVGDAVMCETEHQERLLGILLHMRNNQIYPPHNVASSIKTWFERYKGIKTQEFRWKAENGRAS